MAKDTYFICVTAFGIEKVFYVHFLYFFFFYGIWELGRNQNLSQCYFYINDFCLICYYQMNTNLVFL